MNQRIRIKHNEIKKTEKLGFADELTWQATERKLKTMSRESSMKKIN